MVNPGGIKAGRAYVELGVQDNINAGLRKAERRLRAFGKTIRSVTGQFARIGSVAGGALIAGTIKAASDAQETLSRFKQVFAEQSTAAEQWADTFSSAVGRAKFEVIDALSTFQSLFVGAGAGTAEARQLSQAMTELAVDFASFNNISDAEAFQRFRSALSGSAEVLDRFGVNVRVSALDAKLLEKGLPKVAQGATDLQKKIARLDIIRETMTDQGAMGDAIRTADSFANRMKRLQSQISAAAVEIGQSLLPVAEKFVGQLTELVQRTLRWVKQNKGAILTIAQLSAGLAGLALVLPKILTGMAAISGALATMRSGAIGATTAFGGMVGIFGGVAIASFASSLAKVNNEIARMNDSIEESTNRMKELIAAGEAARSATTGEQRAGALERGIVAAEEEALAVEQERIKLLIEAGRLAREPKRVAGVGGTTSIDPVTLEESKRRKLLEAEADALVLRINKLREKAAKDRDQLVAAKQLAEVEQQIADARARAIAEGAQQSERARVAREKEAEAAKEAAKLDRERGLLLDEIATVGEESARAETIRLAQQGRRLILMAKELGLQEKIGDIIQRTQRAQAISQGANGVQGVGAIIGGFAQGGIAGGLRSLRFQRRAGIGVGGENPFGEFLANVRDALDDLGKRDRVAAAATFSGAAASRIGGGSPAERTAKNTEMTATNTRRILENQRRGVTRFI